MIELVLGHLFEQTSFRAQELVVRFLAAVDCTFQTDLETILLLEHHF